MMGDYYTLGEVAKRWDVSVRQVQRLCNEGRIEGAIRFGKMWAVPKNAVKPTRTGKLKPGRKPKASKEAK